jgi:polygalacturonase
VHISDSQISVGDDCITIKSGRDAEGRRIARPAENYVITNCTMRRGHGGVVIGSEMSGGVKKIAISNCVFDGTDRGIRIKSTRGRGGVVEDVRVSNVLMKGIREEAITLNLFYTQAPPEPVSARTPKFSNIHFNAITAQAEQAATLLGLPESPLENVSLSDVNIVANKGIVIADAKDIRLHAVRVDVATGRAVSAERTDRLVLFDVGPSKMQAGMPPILLIDVSNAFVRGPLARAGAEPVLEVRGPSSRSIALERDSANAKPPVLAGDLPRDAVTVLATWHP